MSRHKQYKHILNIKTHLEGIVFHYYALIDGVVQCFDKLRQFAFQAQEECLVGGNEAARVLLEQQPLYEEWVFI